MTTHPPGDGLRGAGREGELLLYPYQRWREKCRSRVMRVLLNPYLAAIGCVTLATEARVLLAPLLGDRVPFPTYFVAVSLIVWYGGLRPALATLAASTVMAVYEFYPSPATWAATTDIEELAVLVNVLAGAAVIGFGESMYRAHRRAFQAVVEAGAWRREHLAELEQRLWAECDLVQTQQQLSLKVRELEQANLALREMDRLKGEFLNLMSHELRTPLNPIIGFTTLMLDDESASLSPHQREQLTLVERSAESLLVLVDDILAITSIAAGRERPDLEPMSLVAAVDRVVERHRAAARSKHLLLETESRPSVPPVFGDERMVDRILDNLLSNAVKFTNDGGDIRLRICEEDAAVIVEVADTGVGLPAESLEKVFDPFHQESAGLARRHGGTGLGLHLSLRLARLMNGDIKVDSTPGKGSRFRLLLPKGAAGGPTSSASATSRPC